MTLPEIVVKTFAITVFDGVTSTHGQAHRLTLTELAQMLCAQPTVNTGHKTSHLAFTPGCYINGIRDKTKFMGASCLVIDFDGQKHAGLFDGEMLAVVETLQNLGVTYIVYTTYSPGCLRVVLPLAREVTQAEYIELYDHTVRLFPVAADKTGRAACRLHFLPQVPTEAALETHMSEFHDTGKLLDMPARVTQVVAENQTKGAFAGLRLSTAKLAGQARVETFKDLTALLSATENKQEDLNRYVFALAKQSALAGVPVELFGEKCAEAAVAGLSANARPVEDWSLAERTVERAIAAAYDAVREDRDAGSVEDSAGQKVRPKQKVAVPDAIDKRVVRLIKAGKMEDAGFLLGPYINDDDLTADVAAAAIEDAVNDSPSIVSVPDAIDAFRKGIDRAISEDWRAGLKTCLTGPEAGRYLASDENVSHVLRTHPDCKTLFARNIRLDSPAWYMHDAPWGTPAGPAPAGECSRVAAWLCEQLCVGTIGHLRADNCWRNAIALADEYDPCLEYMRALVWDGTPRLDTWLSQYCGAEDCAYTRVVGRKWLLSAVSRTFEPGCKAENVLVLHGEQGVGKTRTVNALVPDEHWFGTIGSDVIEKETAQRMAQWLIAECAEIDRWASKKHSAEFKAFVSERTRKTRPAYGRDLMDFPRRAVLVGTTNREDFLLDDTGARRWWPVLVGLCDVEGLTAVRDQLWAEAVAAWLAGERHYLSPEQIELTKPKQTPLVREQLTPEAEFLAQEMQYLPVSERCALRASANAKLGKVPVSEDQMDGERMRWVTLSQGSRILARGQFRNDEHAVRRAFKVLGLKRNKLNDRFSFTGEE